MTRTALPSKIIATMLAVVSLAALALTVSAMSSVAEAEASQRMPSRVKLHSVQDGDLVGTITSPLEGCVENRKVTLYKQTSKRRRVARFRRLGSTRSNITIDGGDDSPYGAELVFGQAAGFNTFEESKSGRYRAIASAKAGCSKAVSRTVRVR